MKGAEICVKNQHFCKISCDVSMYGCGLSYMYSLFVMLIKYLVGSN
jgi:hypothetical protein